MQHAWDFFSRAFVLSSKILSWKTADFRRDSTRPKYFIITLILLANRRVL